MSTSRPVINRRTLLAGASAAGVAGILAAGRGSARAAANDAASRSSAAAAGNVTQGELPQRAVTNGRIKQSVSLWTMRMPIERLAPRVAALGMASIELVTPAEFPVLKQHGLICAMTSTGAKLPQGFCNPAYHDECVEETLAAINATADAGFPNVICFSGNREGLADDEGARNCIAGLKRVLGQAEKRGVNVCMEVLNSRQTHPDYMCDTVEWAAGVCRGAGSPRMKMLFDIFHVQVQQGDIIDRIGKHKEYIGHYHTAGVPGRHELDDAQELNYPAIMRAILATGFTGYVGHEFSPRRDAITSLREAVVLCDV